MMDVPPYSPDDDKPIDKKRPGQDRDSDIGPDHKPDRGPPPGREPREEPDDDPNEHAPIVDEPPSLSRSVGI